MPRITNNNIVAQPVAPRTNMPVVGNVPTPNASQLNGQMAEWEWQKWQKVRQIGEQLVDVEEKKLDRRIANAKAKLKIGEDELNRNYMTELKTFKGDNVDDESEFQLHNKYINGLNNLAGDVSKGLPPIGLEEIQNQVKDAHSQTEYHRALYKLAEKHTASIANSEAALKTTMQKYGELPEYTPNIAKDIPFMKLMVNQARPGQQEAAIQLYNEVISGAYEMFNIGRISREEFDGVIKDLSFNDYGNNNINNLSKEHMFEGLIGGKDGEEIRIMSDSKRRSLLEMAHKGAVNKSVDVYKNYYLKLLFPNGTVSTKYTWSNVYRDIDEKEQKGEISSEVIVKLKEWARNESAAQQGFINKAREERVDNGYRELSNLSLNGKLTIRAIDKYRDDFNGTQYEHWVNELEKQNKDKATNKSGLYAMNTPQARMWLDLIYDGVRNYTITEHRDIMNYVPSGGYEAYLTMESGVIEKALSFLENHNKGMQDFEKTYSALYFKGSTKFLKENADVYKQALRGLVVAGGLDPFVDEKQIKEYAEALSKKPLDEVTSYAANVRNKLIEAKNNPKAVVQRIAHEFDPYFLVNDDFSFPFILTAARSSIPLRVALEQYAKEEKWKSFEYTSGLSADLDAKGINRAGYGYGIDPNWIASTIQVLRNETPNTDIKRKGQALIREGVYENLNPNNPQDTAVIIASQIRKNGNSSNTTLKESTAIFIMNEYGVSESQAWQIVEKIEETTNDLGKLFKWK